MLNRVGFGVELRDFAAKKVLSLCGTGVLN